MGTSKNHLEKRLDRLFESARKWAVLWGLSRLMRDVSIEFSDETGGTLGRCDPRRLAVTLNAILLLDANEPLLFETLCHELAHIVAALRYGHGIAEHGLEWAEYMERAGFAPRPVIPESMVARR